MYPSPPFDLKLEEPSVSHPLELRRVPDLIRSVFMVKTSAGHLSLCFSRDHGRHGLALSSEGQMGFHKSQSESISQLCRFYMVKLES